MKTAIALIVKFFVTLVAAWVSFMIFGTLSFWIVLMIGAIGTVLNYLIGDLLILPRFGNIIASIVNGIVGGALAWVILLYTPAAYNYAASILVFALIIAVADFFFHMYLISSHVVEKKKSDSDLFRKNKLNYNAETGSELYPYSDKDRFGDSGSSGYNNSTSQPGNGSTNSGTGGGKKSGGR